MHMPLLKELQLKYKELKKQIPKGQATGENISLNDSSDMPYEDFKINGKSEQETRDGKNKFKSLSSTPQSSNVIFESNNAIIDFSNQMDTYFALIFDRKINATYTMVFDCSGVGNSDDIKYIITGNDGIEYNLKNGKNIIKFTTDSSEGKSMTFDDIARQSTSKVTISNIMIVEGEYTEDNVPDYQPYGVMPSPEFQSPIKSVADDVNEYNKDGQLSNGFKNFYAKESIPNGAVGGNIFTTANMNTRCKAYWSIKKGETKTFKLFDSNSLVYMIVVTGIDGIIKSTISLTNNQTVSTYTAEEDGYVCAVFRKRDSTDYTDEEAENLKNSIKICTKEPNVYSEYGKGTVKIIQNGQNWIDLKNIKYQGNCEAVIENNILKLTIKNTGLAGNIYFNCNLKAGDYYVHFDKSIETMNSSSINLAFYNSKGQKISGSNNIYSSSKITLTDEATEMRIYFGTNINKIEIPFEALYINEGDNDLGYTPYQGQDVVVQTKPLRSLPNGVCDEKNGSRTIRRVGEVVLDGTETISAIYKNDNMTRFRYRNITNKALGFDNVICSHFEYERTVYDSDGAKAGICGTSNNSDLYIRIEGDITAEEFQAFLADQYVKGTPVTVCYELAEPIIEEEPCEELKNLHSYKNITNITTEGEVKPELDVTYYKDLETMFKNLEK